MVSSKASRQSAQINGTNSAGSPAHPAGHTALLALARLLARQAAKESVGDKETRTEDDQGPLP
jgi:hypothetical protein